ncbi:MAG: LacI family DNA-binding transcriptional regulator [Micrococcales bacterium]|nr:LacI family DNA-binding transcriptional regulator [Micrococcales bacterium]
MRDVARNAGVSHQTVSRVLNDAPSIRPATRDRVLAAIDELGYRRNQLARALVTARSGTIGVLAALTGQHGPAVTLAAVEAAARHAGFRVTITAPGSEPESVRRGLEFLLAQRVEALVVLAPQQEVFDALAGLPDAVPAVALETAASGARALGVDQQRGARIAVEHLLALGHTRIAHVAGPGDWAEARARIAGWRGAMGDAGLATGEPVPGDWSAASGAAALDAVLTSGATAVFAANDQTALGLLAAARERGIAVPAALSVVGFDDLPEAAFFTPPLPPVRQDLEELGRRAVAVLTAELRGGSADPSPLEPALVIRSSTAPPVR